jgi:hypothetical protein
MRDSGARPDLGKYDELMQKKLSYPPFGVFFWWTMTAFILCIFVMFDADISFDEVASIDFDGVASTSNREVLRELNQAFSTERSEHFAAPNYRPEGKRFKTVTAEELQELEEKRHVYIFLIFCHFNIQAKIKHCLRKQTDDGSKKNTRK